MKMLSLFLLCENAEPVSFMSVAQVTAFQNGIELHKDEMFLERENCLMSIGIGAFAKKVAEDKKNGHV